MKNNQKGFGAVEALVIILIVGLVSFGGWYVLNSRDTSEKSAKNSTAAKEDANSGSKQEDTADNRKTFNCKDLFTVKHPASVKATMTNSTPPQCLLSNVDVEEMPPVGPQLPEQLALFFNTYDTTFTSSEAYLADIIERSQEDHALTLKAKESLKLDNGQTATLAQVYGGHPVQHEYYTLIYIKNGTAITTSYPADSEHKSTALTILKSLE